VVSEPNELRFAFFIDIFRVTNKTNSFMCKVEAPPTPEDSPHTTRAAEIMGEATVEMFMD
jgi:hypothetical protein